MSSVFSFAQSKISTDSIAKKNSVDSLHDDYPSDFVQNFIQSCSASSGGKTAICTCVLDKIRKKYKYAEFISIETKIHSGGSDPDFTKFMGDARKQCVQSN